MKRKMKNWFKQTESAYLEAVKVHRSGYPVLFMVKNDKDISLPIPVKMFDRSPMNLLKPFIMEYVPDAYLFCGEVEIRSYKFKEDERNIADKIRDDTTGEKTEAIMLLGRTMGGEKYRRLYYMKKLADKIILKKDKDIKKLNKIKTNKEP